MGFSDAIRTCLRKYVTFSGRASRSEYWWFMLFLLLGNGVLGLIDRTLFGTTLVEAAPGEMRLRNDGPLSSAFTLATFLPALAAGWRRMHDTGRSGLFLLYPLIVVFGILSFMGIMGGFEPLLGGDLGAALAGATGVVLAVALFVLLISPLVVLWWLTRPSERGANEYGPNPHEVTP